MALSARIGVLALQGAFIEHEKVLRALGCDTFEIRKRSDINESFDGLILPGGESTVQSKLLKDLELFTPLKEKILSGLPTLATCAGLILLAENIVDGEPCHLATMPISVKRNAYGRQLGSFYTEENFLGLGKVPMTFIRAPYITKVHPDVQILAQVDGHIVAAQYHHQLALSFHPELNSSTQIHQLFLQMVQENQAASLM